MPLVAALYGFEFTRAFEAAGLRFRPVHPNHPDAKRLARALDRYHLTGTVTGDLSDPEVIFRLEGVLSFIEHLDVRISEPVEDVAAAVDPLEVFGKEFVGSTRNNGGGAVLGSDAFGPWRSSREAFIDCAMRALSDHELCSRTKLGSLFFKCVETFRQRRPFLEITYFLLFSGLESYARAVLQDYQSKNASEPITRLLLQLGFKVFQDNPRDLPRSMSTYLHLRNALFHQGEFSATVKLNDQHVTLDCSEYLFHLSMLVTLTVMKAVNFDDGHTNWDCWIDRRLLK